MVKVHGLAPKASWTSHLKFIVKHHYKILTSTLLGSCNVLWGLYRDVSRLKEGLICDLGSRLDSCSDDFFSRPLVFRVFDSG